MQLPDWIKNQIQTSIAQAETIEQQIESLKSKQNEINQICGLLVKAYANGKGIENFTVDDELNLIEQKTDENGSKEV